MTEQSAIVDAVLSTRLVGIVRLKHHGHAGDIARAISDGGLTVIEYSLSGSGALEAVAAAREALQAAGVRAFIGAGTVLDKRSAQDAVNAGAQFIVTPALELEVVSFCRDRGIPVLCGALTPTELLAAHRAGADFVKLFPARGGGPAYVRDVLAPLPFLKLVPTGGVSAENAAGYLSAGAAAVAIGGNLVSDDNVANQNWTAITAHARDLVGAVRSV